MQQQDARGAGGDAFDGHHRGGPEYRRLVAALFAGGFATFAQIFDAQAVLPVIARDLEVSPATAALSVSATTIGLAVSVLFWASLSDRVGRTRAMTWSLAGACAFSLAAPLMPSFAAVLAMRLLLGVALGAVPAVAMAYLNEEVHRSWVPVAAGTYIAGNTIGGIVGRLVAGPVGEWLGWRAALLLVGAICAVMVLVFARLVPEARGFRGRADDAVPAPRQVARHLRSPRLLAVYLTGACSMGAFAAVYNYLGFRVSTPPFGVPVALVSLLFLAYLFGTAASRLSGELVRRVGPAPVVVLGVALVLASLLALAAERLAVVVAGLVVFTAGIFFVHPVASGLSGSLAVRGRAQSTALYQLSWLLGTAGVGWAAGRLYAAQGWGATLVLVAALVAVPLLTLVPALFAAGSGGLLSRVVGRKP